MSMHRRSWLWIAIGVAVVARIVIFGVAFDHPVANEGGAPTSPKVMQSGTDIGFYLRSSQKYLRISPVEILRSISKYYDFDDADRDSTEPHSLDAETIDYFVAPPAFPVLLNVFRYRDGNTLPLALLYLVVSCVLVTLWLKWLSDKQVGFAWLVTFALIPNPIWFTISISTDLLFALSFAGFYLLYFSKHWPPLRVALWVGFLLFCLLTRPNGLSVFLFVAADLALSAGAVRRPRPLMFGFLSVVALAFAFVLLPHFVIFARRGMQITYFGFSQAEYLGGVFRSVPVWLNLPLSWLSLSVAKILYFAGLRPSYGDISWTFLVLRGAAGLILLPGLVYVFAKGDRKHQMLIGLYLLPVFLGATQDRYNLAIQPVLFFYGVLALHAVWNRFGLTWPIARLNEVDGGRTALPDGDDA